jgi:hypothetical protein
MFEKMSPQQAAGVFLREDGMLALPVNVELEPGKPTTYEDSLPNPLGGPPIKANGKIVLNSIDRAKGVASLSWSLELDPVSASASIGQAVTALAAQLAPEKAAEAQAMLKGMTVERISTCLYEVNLTSGLPVKADCEARLSVTDPKSGGKNGRNERWVMTQTLKN